MQPFKSIRGGIVVLVFVTFLSTIFIWIFKLVHLNASDCSGIIVEGSHSHFNLRQSTFVDEGSDSPILKRLQLSEQNWYEAVLLRHKFVANKNGVDKIQLWGGDGTIVWNLFAPTFDCPFSKKRIGTIGDSGKWICGFELLEETKVTQKPCVVYSFGVNEESSFEADFLERTDCQVFAYDMTVGGMGPQIANINSKLRFKPVGLGAHNSNNFQTLPSLMKENEHVWIDVLKMDIEGSEFHILDSLVSSFDILPFGQLLIEIHLGAITFPQFYYWFEQLEKKGLRPFSAEANFIPVLFGGKPEVMEYAFINVKANHMLVPSGFVSKI